MVNNGTKREITKKKPYIIMWIIFTITFILLFISLSFQHKKYPNGFIFNDNILRITLFIMILLYVIFGLVISNAIFKPVYDFKRDFYNTPDFSFIDKTKEPIKTDDYLYNNLLNHNIDISDVYKTYAESIDEEEKIEAPSNGSRFYMLTHIDEEMRKATPRTYNSKITLEEICNEFRNFSAYKLHLYYDIKDIRRFIASLYVTKLILLQGMSGTGKTSLAYAFGEYLNNKTVVIPIQPMWKERTDLIGYYNEFTKKFNETTLLNKMYEANYSKDIYITVLDEMNIARVEYYFAEFLSLLELPNPESRNIDVVSDVWDNDPKLLREGKLRLPINMWFIGTANNDDSTFAVSDKVYDRAMVINLDKKAEQFDGKPTSQDPISALHIYELFKKAELKNKLSQRNRRRISELDKYLIETFSLTFGNRIMKQIEKYVPVVVECGGTELDAIDDIISRKILRKLESKNPVYVRSQSEALINKINDLFGENKLVQCIEQIRHLEQNA